MPQERKGEQQLQREEGYPRISDFSERIPDSFYYDVFRIAASTGMRCGEIGALKNSDIYDGMIHVKRTITRGTAGYEIGSDTKTTHGQRNIPINAEIKEILEHQKHINTMMSGSKATPTS